MFNIHDRKTDKNKKRKNIKSDKKEQAGFRKGRSRCEQIFTLRQIIEKVQAREISLRLFCRFPEGI